MPQFIFLLELHFRGFAVRFIIIYLKIIALSCCPLRSRSHVLIYIRYLALSLSVPLVVIRYSYRFHLSYSALSHPASGSHHTPHHHYSSVPICIPCSSVCPCSSRRRTESEWERVVSRRQCIHTAPNPWNISILPDAAYPNGAVTGSGGTWEPVGRIRTEWERVVRRCHDTDTIRVYDTR